MKRNIVVIAAVLSLAACASFPPTARADDVTDAAKSLASTAAADLDVAVKIANENGDADGASCATAIKAWLIPPAAPVSSVTPTVAIGLFSKLEEGRVKGKSVDSVIQKILAGAPRDVVVGCAMVAHDAKTFLVRMGSLLAGAK